MRHVLIAMLAACKSGGGTIPDTSATSPTDADTDADADADADTDADTDTTTADTAVDTTGTDGLVFDDDHVLVVPDQEGLRLVRNDGSVGLFATWTALVGSCGDCGGEGASADGDGLLLSFTTGGLMLGGAVARLDSSGALDWRVDGFAFPHDAIRDPADDTIIVPEANSNKVVWIAGDGSSDDTLRQMTPGNPNGYDGGLPNGAERFDWNGGSYLLLSHRATGGGFGPTGEITLWDITGAGTPSLVWRYPGSGFVATPHGPILREWDGQWWFLYAHSDGAGQGGASVGIAVTGDPTVLPQYVADLLPPKGEDEFVFVRGVELTADGQLIVTDSGAEGGIGFGDDGKIFEAPMPSLAPTGATGAADTGDQVFVPLSSMTLLLDGLVNPFEGWLWEPTIPLP